MEKDSDSDGWTTLHLAYMHNERSSLNVINNLITRHGIGFQFGGEFGISDFFHIPSEWKEAIHIRRMEWWFPILQHDMALIAGQPMLHAALLSKAPREIIVDIIQSFDSYIKHTKIAWAGILSR